MRRVLWWAFAAYCVLQGSGWLLGAVPGWLGVGVYAVVGIVAVGVNGRVQWMRPRELGGLAFGAVLLMAVPELVARAARGHVAGALGSAVMALVPMFVVLMVVQGDADGVGEARGLMVPALVGMSGVLLLLPLDLPGSLRGRITLGLLVLAAVLVAMASVALHRMLRGVGFVQSVAVVCLANALVLGVVDFWEGVPGGGVDAGAWVAAGVMGISVVLLVALLRGMEPARFGARFLVVPLVGVVEGYVLLRPELTLRMGVGVALLAGGAGWLLFSQEQQEVASLRLR